MKKLEIYAGQRFGKLSVLKEVEPGMYPRRFLCLCDCGRETVVRLGDLRSGSSKSCGCLARSHGCSSKDSPYFKLHQAWGSMIGRARGTIHKRNPHYFHVTVCDEWLSFENFKKWSIDNGWKVGLTLDRKNNSEGYCPENCRWTTCRVQTLNRDYTLTYNGEPLVCLYERECDAGISYKTFRYRVRSLGWGVQRALHEKPRKKLG